MFNFQVKKQALLEPPGMHTILPKDYIKADKTSVQLMTEQQASTGEHQGGPAHLPCQTSAGLYCMQPDSMPDTPLPTAVQAALENVCPGRPTVMMSEMPLTPWRSTSSATRKAWSMGMSASTAAATHGMLRILIATAVLLAGLRAYSMD